MTGDRIDDHHVGSFVSSGSSRPQPRPPSSSFPHSEIRQVSQSQLGLCLVSFSLSRLHPVRLLPHLSVPAPARSRSVPFPAGPSRPQSDRHFLELISSLPFLFHITTTDTIFSLPSHNTPTMLVSLVVVAALPLLSCARPVWPEDGVELGAQEGDVRGIAHAQPWGGELIDWTEGEDGLWKRQANETVQG